MFPTVTPFPTPTPYPTPSGPPIIDLTPVANAIVGKRIAIETVALWNTGIAPYWEHISLFLLIIFVLLRFRRFFFNLKSVTGDD